MSAPRVCMVIDYQNIHLTARDLFAPPGTAPEACLIDPLKFAERVIAVRTIRQRIATHRQAELSAVKVFRGSPSNAREPVLYGVTQRQRSEWTRDRRVDVNYRTLRYPRGWPTSPAREKGIDVLIALTFVELANSGSYDVLILATHDTDLEPALELAARSGRTKIETAGWSDARVLRPNGQRLWHTSLDGGEMVATRDRRQYAAGQPEQHVWVKAAKYP